ncbi:MAG: AI-2E family transporter [Bacteroidota bacterium]
MQSLTLEKVIRGVIGLLAILVGVWLVYTYATLVGYVIIATIFSYILDPLVNRLQSSGMNRTAAILVALAAVILILVWISTSVIPIIASQMVGLAQQLSVENIQMIANKLEGLINNDLPFLPPGFLTENLTRAAETLFDVGQLPSAISNVIGIFTNIFLALLIIPFATFFFLKDGSDIRRSMLTLVPNKYFETTLSLIDKIETRLGVYFKSVLFQSTLVAITSWITLSFAGLDNSLSVGISVGIANTIPYFGPVIGYILSILISILETGDFSLVGACILAILIVQVMDNLLFQPLIFSRAAQMHPVAILFVIMIGSETAGILGMLLAVPIATIIKITINQITWSLNNYYVFRSDQNVRSA